MKSFGPTKRINGETRRKHFESIIKKMTEIEDEKRKQEQKDKE